MKNKIFEIKSFARIKFFQNEEIFSQKINLFDKIYFEEKNNSNWWIEIRKKEWDFWNIKFPTNAENSCYFAAKEMQRFYAKKNQWNKPKSIIITIEKNIPLNSWLWWFISNWYETLNFLNKFWEINLSEENILEIWEKIFWEKILIPKKIFSDKKFFILIPKYISVEKKFFEKILENSENFFEAQKKIKNIFPDLEKFIKIFLENWVEFSDISWKGWVVFWVFDENISEEETSNLKNIFSKFWDFILV